jgi:hypothetical protein
MDEILQSLDRHEVPSIQWPGPRGVMYFVSVERGHHVTLSHPERGPSVLAWDKIERVYNAARAGMEITIANVDNLLGDDPAGHDASTMCALVLAMLDPSRKRRANSK